MFQCLLYHTIALTFCSNSIDYSEHLKSSRLLDRFLLPSLLLSMSRLSFRPFVVFSFHDGVVGLLSTSISPEKFSLIFSKKKMVKIINRLRSSVFIMYLSLSMYCYRIHQHFVTKSDRRYQGNIQTLCK